MVVDQRRWNGIHSERLFSGKRRGKPLFRLSAGETWNLSASSRCRFVDRDRQYGQLAREQRFAWKIQGRYRLGHDEHEIKIAKIQAIEQGKAMAETQFKLQQEVKKQEEEKRMRKKLGYKLKNLFRHDDWDSGFNSKMIFTEFVWCDKLIVGLCAKD